MSTKSRQKALKADSVDVDEPPLRFETALAAIAHLERQLGPASKVWTYKDHASDVVGYVLRWDATAKRAKKIIRPVSRLEGRWAICGMKAPRPLYGLDRLLAVDAAMPVLITEGEKAADAASALGFLATTSPHGAKSPQHADWSILARRELVVLPDRDIAGSEYAETVVKQAQAVGVKSVRVVHLHNVWPDMPEGGDMADLVQHFSDQPRELRRKVEEVMSGTEPEKSAPRSPDDYVPFPTEALPDPVSAFIRVASTSIGCDPAYVALPLLAALGAAIGNSRRIALKNAWSEPAIIWTAVVGESGTLKSPALELALKPIRSRQRDALRQYAEEMKGHELSRAIYERDLTLWKRSRSKEPPPAMPDEPLPERVWTDDATTEAIAVLLRQNPRGLLMARDELGAWFNFDRYANGKGGDAAKWLEMFGGRELMVDRKGGPMLHVPRAAVSITGGIQPQTLKRSLGQEHRDNGLAARLLLACPPRVPKRWTDTDIDPKVEAALNRLFTGLFDLQGESGREAEVAPVLIPLSPDGKKSWVTYFDEHAREQAELTGDLAAAWSKLEGYGARLALVIHCVRCVTNDPTLKYRDAVDSRSVSGGVSLARWFGNEARRVYGVLDESDSERAKRQLIELIQRKGGDINARELVQTSRRFKSTSQAEIALTGLVNEEHGSWYQPRTEGPGAPKAKRFRLNATPVNVYRMPVDPVSKEVSVDESARSA